MRALALGAGNITALVVKGSSTTEFREKMASLVTYMNRMHLNHKLRDEMRKVWGTEGIPQAQCMAQNGYTTKLQNEMCKIRCTTGTPLAYSRAPGEMRKVRRIG